MSTLLSSKKMILFILPPIFFPLYTESRFIEIHNTQEFNQHIINNNAPAIVEFYADWCGACQAVKSSFQQLAQEFQQITFAQVNIDQNTEIAKKYAISGIPTFLYFQNGKNVKSEIGVNNTVDFATSLRNNIRTLFNMAPSDTAGQLPDTMSTMIEETDIVVSDTPDATEDQYNITITDTDDNSYQSTDDTVYAEKELTLTITPSTLYDTFPDKNRTLSESSATATGFFGHIGAMITAFFNAIKSFIVALLDAIKGLFGR